MDPKGTIIFNTVERANYGFDIFSIKLPTNLTHPISENLLTDTKSINFNGQFVDENQTLVYISERSGSAQIYLNKVQVSKQEESLFHDRPVIKNGKLYFVSAHEEPDKMFKSWCGLYSRDVGVEGESSGGERIRLTPVGGVDYSPAVSETGRYVAVAAYGSGPWGGEFHELETDIVVFREEDPGKRAVVCRHGGWPTWCGDSTIYFHRQAEDGWWSVFRVDLSEDFEVCGSGDSYAPRRVTPSGVHCFTPAAMHNRKQIAVATRRRESDYRHIEIFDIESNTFYPVTKLINPSFHHYNPFISPKSGFLGYHRFRGESSAVMPHLELVSSPIKGLRMLRLNGAFPSFSPDGDLISFNHGFDSTSGLKIVKSDGSKRWTVLKNRVTFYTSWSPLEKNVIYTSIGPIFKSVKATVQIARISFNLNNLNDDSEDVDVDVKILTREDTGNNAFPACSPDGKHVVFRSGRSGHKNLYLIDAVNGEFEGGIRQLTDGPWIDTMPCWSPDGNLIAFSSNRHNRHNVETFSIYVMRPDGTDVKRIYVAGLEGSSDVDKERINHVCFSGDGKWLLFTANISGVTAEPVSLPNQFQPYGDLHVMRLDGSGLRRITWNGYENGTPTWNWGDELKLESLCVKDEIGDKLLGEFIEPLWINCNF